MMLIAFSESLMDVNCLDGTTLTYKRSAWVPTGVGAAWALRLDRWARGRRGRGPRGRARGRGPRGSRAPPAASPPSPASSRTSHCPSSPSRRASTATAWPWWATRPSGEFPSSWRSGRACKTLSSQRSVPNHHSFSTSVNGI